MRDHLPGFHRKLEIRRRLRAPPLQGRVRRRIVKRLLNFNDLELLNEEERIKLHNDVQHLPYRSAIGSLMFLSNCTRPDITYAVNKLSSYNSNPNEFHWKAAKRILKYLKK